VANKHVRMSLDKKFKEKKNIIPLLLRVAHDSLANQTVRQKVNIAAEQIIMSELRAVIILKQMQTLLFECDIIFCHFYIANCRPKNLHELVNI
jgi:hypothetical protein